MNERHEETIESLLYTQTDKTFKKMRKNALEIRKNTVFTHQ
jgi:hypothetical protein